VISRRIELLGKFPKTSKKTVASTGNLWYYQKVNIVLMTERAGADPLLSFAQRRMR